MTGIPVAYQLFGPVQGPAGLTQSSPIEFAFVGSALTASTVQFGFQHRLARVKEATWSQIWTTPNPANIARLVHLETGPKNITEMAQLPGDARGQPSRHVVDVTEQMNALVQLGVHKHIGFQVKGDVFSRWTLYESVLEVVWDLSGLVGEPGPPGPPGPPGSIPGSFNATIAVTP